MDRAVAGFPEGFLWGAATSAYQIEGSPLADGAGPSIWHRFSHTPGRVLDGDTGDVACDHYRRWPDDVELMHRLGLGAYRFSIAWARVLPEGRGRANPAGLAFYDRLVDALLERGIQPAATLYHWDLPAALEDRGGWLDPDSAGWFADYARLVFGTLGDRVALWATLNEPWVVVDAGYLHGVHAPGRANPADVPVAAHNLLRAHGAAVQAFRAEREGRIGIVVNLEPKDPAGAGAEDLAAASRADVYMNRQFLDPVLLGRYPEELPELYGDVWPTFPDSDLSRIHEPVDFIGVNYYKRGVTRHDPSDWPARARLVPQPQSPHTAMGPEWEIHPPGLTRILTWVTDRYGDMPLYVTENGAAFHDPPRPIDGGVDDPLRVRYLRDHLRAARDAIARGVPLRGYFAWSLLDNFEWGFGYSRRFGIVHIDFETQRRTPKSSASFYADVIRSNGAALDAAAGSSRDV